MKMTNHVYMKNMELKVNVLVQRRFHIISLSLKQYHYFLIFHNLMSILQTMKFVSMSRYRHFSMDPTQNGKSENVIALRPNMINSKDTSKDVA